MVTIKVKDKKLQELRVRKGWSLRDLAKKAKVSDAFLSQVERDIRNPGPQTAFNICEALGCKFDEVFYTLIARKSDQEFTTESKEIQR